MELTAGIRTPTIHPADYGVTAIALPLGIARYAHYNRLASGKLDHRGQPRFSGLSTDWTTQVSGAANRWQA